ncbi:hypothetical protein BO71DRAFT_433627 [Aspergillus ellipticus CBS 707.79]|uniref:Uncharacterized protein n=1 Tax=Aspergillus ellipticus CBS 707.79 TaxID=1448320 RepID=A0A319CZA7_9EURO|nr:hypothetical protein BO71DRAFT_433627 [Aspergillus ellipticus CBS 707.79]
MLIVVTLSAATWVHSFLSSRTPSASTTAILGPLMMLCPIRPSGPAPVLIRPRRIGPSLARRAGDPAALTSAASAHVTPATPIPANQARAVAGQPPQLPACQTPNPTNQGPTDG